MSTVFSGLLTLFLLLLVLFQTCSSQLPPQSASVGVGCQGPALQATSPMAAKATARHTLPIYSTCGARLIVHSCKLIIPYPRNRVFHNAFSWESKMQNVVRMETAADGALRCIVSFSIYLHDAFFFFL